MNILITGINGFIGSNLITALKDQHCIFGLDIISTQKEGVSKTYFWNELEKINSIDVIIHLAGIAHDTKKQTSAETYFDINTGLTKKIYDWFLKSSAKKFIFFSSVKSVADRVIGDLLTEEAIPKPVGAYGESKIAAENYILNHLSNDKIVFILRPCMVHGPGNKGNLNLLYKFVKKGIPYPLGAYENRRSYTSIDNLTFILLQLIGKEIPGGIYNVGDDESLSTNDLIALMAETMNKPNRTWKWNKMLLEFCAGLGSLLHLPFNSDRLQKLTENYVVSNDKIKKALGITKMPFTAKEGFIITINSFENK